MRAPTPSAAAEMVIASSDELRGQVASLIHRQRMSMENRLAALYGRLEALSRSLHDPRTTLEHLAQRMDDLIGRLDMALLGSVRRSRECFNRFYRAMLYLSPADRIENLRQRTCLLSVQIERLLRQRMDGLKKEFSDNAARLEVLSPLKTLARGYAIATCIDNGKVITDAGKLTAGEQLSIKLWRGAARCRVEELDISDSPSVNFRISLADK